MSRGAIHFPGRDLERDGFPLAASAVTSLIGRCKKQLLGTPLTGVWPGNLPHHKPQAKKQCRVMYKEGQGHGSTGGDTNFPSITPHGQQVLRELV